MKGKRLFQLIKDLSKTEHRQLINACKISADKRTTALGQLLRKRNLTESGFEKWLSDLAASWNLTDAAERDKKQRRWIDYACKETEQLLIMNQFEDSNKRHHELASIFDKRNHEELTGYYNHLSLQTAQSTQDINALLGAYDRELRWLGRNQTQKNIDKIAALLYKRKQATELAFHQAMSYFYTVSSALYVDNPNQESYLKIVPGSKQFSELRQAANEEYSQVLYRLAEARFNFYQPALFEQHLKAVWQAIHTGSLSEESKQHLTRSFYYLRITGGLYYGFDLKQMIQDAEAMLHIMLRYKIYDSIGFFFLLFFLLLDKNTARYDTLLKKHGSVFFTADNHDYLLFLESLRLYLNNQADKALDHLLHTSYSKSLYVAAWSKLLEIEIHSARNDKRLVKVLTARAKRFLKTNSGHRIIFDPLTQVLNTLEQPQGKKANTKAKGLFTYYAMFLRG